ncbi:MAG TPA: ABC transporter permease [Polyangia bacterium]|nr:ABC transporter permease [Polyangia bacterium]
MKPILLIARRELAAYLRSMSGYAIMAAALFVDGLFFNGMALGGEAKRSSEVLAVFFQIAGGVTMIASVLLSMRLLAEERQAGTITLLYSSPLRDREIVIGKFLSALVMLAIITAATVYMPALILVNGKISWGQVGAGYLGVLLLGSAALAVGTFGSSLARSQVIAALISACMVAALVVCWMLARVTERPLSEIFAALALWNRHFPPFTEGVVHLRDLTYYVGITYVALFGGTRVLEARRWR